jgi:hypothetical protein
MDASLCTHVYQCGGEHPTSSSLVPERMSTSGGPMRSHHRTHTGVGGLASTHTARKAVADDGS